jgi:hypothetical protein
VPSLPELNGGVGTEVAALLFMTSAMFTLDAYSTFESSPWTAENFGADAAKVASAREYLWHAVGFSMVYAFASAIIAKSWWPLLGATVANAYLVWLYLRAFERGKASGSTGWAKG